MITCWLRAFAATYPDYAYVTDNKVRCPMDSLNENFTLQGYSLLYFTIIKWYTCIVLMLCRAVEVRVSLNGVDYVPNSVFIRIDDCTVSCTHTHTHTHSYTPHTHISLIVTY